MKYISCTIMAALFLLACNNNNQVKITELNNRIDSLTRLQPNAYKPGLGEFMSGIQMHHAKLWFAGINNNWQLADFEVHEIMEAFDDIKTFETDRPEVKSIGMIAPAVDSVNEAIKNKNTVKFRNSFLQLTNTCNSCHKAVNFSFNVVTIPTAPPVTNQDFKVAN